MMRLTMTLALLLTMLSGCAGKITPTRPTLDAMTHPYDAQGRCFDRANLRELLLYINRLEDACD